MSTIYSRFRLYFNGNEVKKFISIQISHSYGVNTSSECEIYLPYSADVANLPMLTIVTVTAEYLVKPDVTAERTIFVGYPTLITADKRGGVVTVVCKDLFAFLSRIPILSLSLSQGDQAFYTIGIGSFIDGAGIYKLQVPKFDTLIDANIVKVTGKNKKAKIRKNIIDKIFNQLEVEISEGRLKGFKKRKYMFDYVKANEIYKMFDFAFTDFDLKIIEQIMTEYLIQLMKGEGSFATPQNSLLDYFDAIFNRIFRYIRVPVTPRFINDGEDKFNASNVYIPMESYYEMPPAYVYRLESTEHKPYITKRTSPSRLIAVSEMFFLTEAGENVKIRVGKGKAISVQTVLVAPFKLYRETLEFLKDARGNLKDLKRKIVNVDEIPSKLLADIAIASSTTDEEIMDGVEANTFMVPFHLKALALAFGKIENTKLSAKDKEYFKNYILAAAENYYRILKSESMSIEISGLVLNPLLTCGFPILFVSQNFLYYGVISMIVHAMDATSAPFTAIKVSNFRSVSRDEFIEQLKTLARWCRKYKRKPRLKEFLELLQGNHLWYPLDLDEDFIPTRFNKDNYRDVATRYGDYRDSFDIYSVVINLVLQNPKWDLDRLDAEIVKRVNALHYIGRYDSWTHLKSAMSKVDDVGKIEDRSEWPDKEGKKKRDSRIRWIVSVINSSEVLIDVD